VSNDWEFEYRELYLIGNVSIMATPLPRGGALGLRCGGGVFAAMLVNTPLHPSQEGNRPKELMNTIKKQIIAFIIAPAAALRNFFSRLF
jgi:hypothetical protein